MRELYKLFAFLRSYRLYVVLAPLLMVVEVALDLLQPRFVQHIIDEGIGRLDNAVIIRTGLLMLGTSLVAMFACAGCAFFAVRAAHGMGGEVRGVAFRRIQTLSFSQLDRQETGSLITRLTSDVNQIQEMVAMLLRGMVRMPLLLIGSVLMATLIDARLGRIFFVILPVLIISLLAITRASFPIYREVQRRLDALNTVLQENLAGVRVVKAFARAQHEIQRFAQANEALIERTIAAVRVSAFTAPVMMLTLNAGIVAALWIGGHRVHAGEMKIGQVVAFISYLTQALNALIIFSNMVIQVSRAQASARRVAELLAIEPALSFPPEPELPSPPRPRRGARIAFENVTFGYAGPGHDPELKDISFSVEPGETVAILGATGSGKSSLVQLVPRFYEVSSGRVTIDDVDVRDIPESELRGLVSIALQESVLFSATVRDNIALGKPSASSAEISQVATVAEAHGFIEARPEGYGTLVGQRGVNLSGGQKQRIAIARALLPGAPVLILDDSTSAIDLATEARIQMRLEQHDGQQTRLIVTQRVSSAAQADRIIVLDDGTLVGQGSHEELLTSCAVYREIEASQATRRLAGHGQH